MEIIWIALCLAVFCGALVQRVSGLGFALMTAPFLVLAAGPFQGVLLVNVLTITVNLTVLAKNFGQVEWKRAAVLVPAGVLGSATGAIAARSLPITPLQILEGTLVLIGLAVTLSSSRVRLKDNAGNMAMAGVVSGFMTATAGAGGPALTFYALASRWTPSFFTSTAQIGFAAQAATAVALKGFPNVSFFGFIPLFAALVLGVSLGRSIENIMPAQRVRRLVIVLAVAGSVATIVKAVLELDAPDPASRPETE